MGIITNIEQARGYMTVDVDGMRLIKTREKYLREFGLSVGDAIDEEILLPRLAQKQFADAYEAALTLLDFSARTKREIVSALLRKGFVALAAESVAQKLIESRLVDDAAYARRVAENKIEKPIGVYALKRKLRAKGLADDDIASALEGFDDEHQINAAKTMLKKLMPRYAGEDARAARHKLTGALARRGFSYDAIRAAFDACQMDEDEFID